MNNEEQVREIWERLTAWFDENDEYFVEETLNPGVEAEDLESLEELLGRPLPGDLKASLQVYDGCAFDTFHLIDETWALLDAKSMGQFYKSLQTEGLERSEYYLPIARSGGGDYVLIDLETGELRRQKRDQENLPLIAASYLEWISAFLTEVESGALEIDEGSGLYRN